MRKFLVLCALSALLLFFANPPASAQMKVFVVAGQSNAVGYASNAAQLPPKLYPALVKVMFNFEEGPWNSVTNPGLRISSQGFRPLKFQSDPNYGTFGPYTDGFGAEINIGHTLSRLLLSDVALMKFAFNATSLAHDWHPTTGSLYPELVDFIDNSMTDLTNLGLVVELGGICWMQGEWDAQNHTYAMDYEANLTLFIQQLRTDLGYPNLPFMIGKLNENIYLSSAGIDKSDLDLVRAAQENVAGTLPMTAVFSTDDLPLNADFLHFTADGQLGLGFRFSLAYLGLDTILPPANLTETSTIDLHPGDRIRHSVTGTPGTGYMIIMSLNGGPLNTPWGVAGVGLPFFILYGSTIKNAGYDTVTFNIIDPGPGYYKWYTHALVNSSPRVWAFGGNNPNGTNSIVWSLNSP